MNAVTCTVNLMVFKMPYVRTCKNHHSKFNHHSICANVSGYFHGYVGYCRRSLQVWRLDLDSILLATSPHVGTHRQLRARVRANVGRLQARFVGRPKGSLRSYRHLQMEPDKISVQFFGYCSNLKSIFKSSQS